MAQCEAGVSTDEESLKDVFDEAMRIFEDIENGKEPTNSDPVQLSIKSAISKFEKATNMVSLTGIFSTNENVDELPTESLQYLLLPALLGTLSLKLCNQPRKDLIAVAEVYFRDFLQRCNDYSVSNVKIPQHTDSNDSSVERCTTEQAKIANMVLTREAKIKRYKEMKELKEKLENLRKQMSSDHVDDEVKRAYFITLLTNYVSQALDELNSIEQEKPILDYMAKNAGEPKPKPKTTPLKPVIITKDALQKAVFGAGYPAIPAMTVEEFYDQRVKEGLFPSGSNIPHTTIQSTEGNSDESEEVTKENLIETDDPEELARQRNMDEYKDDHRRGWGNRYNRS